MKSPEISRELGGYILSKFNNLKVDVHNPDIIVTVEVREKYAFVRGNNIRGAGGMPTGTNGRAAILISGGIDSPVAAYMMAKRGIELCAVHFASPPYTSELAEMKVMDLLKSSTLFGCYHNLCCTFYRTSGSYKGLLPGGVFYNYYAPPYDEAFAENCRNAKLHCPYYR